MAVISLTSAKGSPGVTTTALAMALVWPRPCLLVEADVAGSSSILAGYFQGTIPHDRGLIDLASAYRRGELADGVNRAAIALGDSNARFVPGLRSPAQAGTMQRMWEPLAVVLRALESTGTDVIVDAGRTTGAGAPLPLIRESDLALLVTRSDLPAVAATRALAGGLREEMVQRGVGEDALGLLLVGEGRPFGSKEIQQVTGLAAVTSMPWDPQAAEVLALGKSRSAGKGWQNSKLVRGAKASASTLGRVVQARRSRLMHAGPSEGQWRVGNRG